MKSLNRVAAGAAWSALALGGMAHAQEAVQWRVEDGGNGHWYSKLIWQEPVIWEVAHALAVDVGADLVSIALSGEQDWVSKAMDLTHEPCPGYVGWFIGAYQDLEAANYHEPADGWRWSDGEPWNWTNWASHAPDNWGGTQHWGMMYDHGLWDDAHSGPGGSEPICRAIIEYSADCNGDGIVDYGQILDGRFEDANANGVPDCCDEGVDCAPCVGDVNFDGQVNGADISVLLGFWGLNGKPNNADTNDDGQVDGADLANVLGNWGECQ